MKKILTAMALMAAMVIPASAQQQQQQQGGKDQQAELMAKMKAEAEAYYANADTAEYGVRYRFKYKYNKARNLKYEEDRVVLVRPEKTLDMSYQGIGETRWRLEHPESRGGDMSLAYHLTPSFYFYYPQSDRLVRTYRVIADEFKLSDGEAGNKWNITSEERKIGDYNCRKATCEKDGRKWTAWFTTDLPHQAAPRTLVGLPGVVLEAVDGDGEICWVFNGIVKNIPDGKLYIKYPEQFTSIPVEQFPKIERLFGYSDNNYLKSSGVMEMHPAYYPEKYRPSTGTAALNIDNPIEK